MENTEAKHIGNNDKIKIFLLGMVVAVGMMFLMGAGGNSGNVGRYQLESLNDNLYMYDTKTGRIKHLRAQSHTKDFTEIRSRNNLY